MYQRDPWRELIGGGRGRPPRSLVILLGLLVAGAVGESFAELRPALELLRLSPDVWEHGQLWRLVTYGLVGTGGIGFWSAFQLFLVYWFAMEVMVWLGIARTRVLVLGGIVVSSAAATVVQYASNLVGGPFCDDAPFWMMQGQVVVLSIVMAGFAARNRWASVSHTPFLWGLPIPSRWLVPLQLLAAIAGFAATRDLGGLVGIATASFWGFTVARPRRG